MFENKVLRDIWAFERQDNREVEKTAKLYDLQCSPITIQVIKSRRMRRAGQVGSMGGKTTSINGVWWENLWETSLGRPRHRRENNIKMDLQELEWGHGLH